MAAIDGIASASHTSTQNYQVKQTPQVNSVEAVNEERAQGSTVDIAAQVITVKGNDSAYNGQNGTGTEQKEDSQATQEQIRRAVEELNKNMKNTICEYGIHDGTNRVTIKIVDKDTEKVIREYPAEETLDMIAKVWELAGLMVDKRL